MKELRWIALILAALVILMGVQTFILYRQNEALNAALAQAQTDIAAMRGSLSEFSEIFQALRDLWQELAEKGGLLKWLNLH